MSSNTLIYIKRSEANNTPGTLHAGELAYSYASNTLFIGANTATGPGYLEIGGQFYTNVINSATSSNVADTLIKRDANGDFAAGNVTAAFFIGDGSALTGIATDLTFTGDSGGPNTLHLQTDTLTFTGGEGITTVVNGNDLTIDVDDTVFRANSGLEGSVQFVDSPVVFTGNVTFTGNTVYNNVTSLEIDDPIIYLAANNYYSDAVDIGFAANYFDGTDQRHTGFFRHNSSKEYYIFDNYLPEPDETNVIDPTDASFRLARLHVEKVTGNVLANNVTSDGFLAAEGNPDSGNTGYSFSLDQDTGMFSPSAGELELWSQNQRIITANTTLVFFEQDLKLKNAGLINNPSGLLELNPDETNEDDRYLVIDPTAPNHIHLRAGGTIDNSTADLFLGGEENYVRVSDGSANVEIRTNNTHNFQFTDQGKFQLANGTSIYDSLGDAGFFVDPIRANNAVGGNVTAYNTTTKELVHTDVVINNSGITLANGTTISDGESGFFVDSLAYDAAPLDSSNIVLYNASTGEITYGPIGDLNPAQLANGSHTWTVSADTGALYSDQGTAFACSANSVIIGQNVDLTNSNSGRVAIGEYAANTSQSAHAIAIGSGAGNSNQDTSAIAIGQDAGETDQSFSAVAVGRWAGQTNQGWDSVAVGRRAGRSNQGDYSVAMGWGAGVDYQSSHSVAIGDAAGAGYQSSYAVAIGSSAGNTAQGWGATAIGTNAGTENQDVVATAVGSNAGRWNQGQGAVAVGRRAGENTQGYYSVAIGNRAGASSQGDYSIAIGAYASPTGQANNSVVLNASGSTLNADTSGFFVNPVAYTETQDAVYDGLMFYNSNSKEIRYSYALDGGSF